MGNKPEQKKSHCFHYLPWNGDVFSGYLLGVGYPQKTWPQCLQWCLRTTTEKSVLQHLHQNTALSLTQRGPFSLCFGCWNFFSGLLCRKQNVHSFSGEKQTQAEHQSGHSRQFP